MAFDTGDDRYDVIVIGAGACGLSTAWSLARRGRSVLVLDRFTPGHNRGSSHGTERIVRLGHVDPIYVGLALDALDGWREIEHHSGAALIIQTGAIDLSDEKSGEAELVEMATACAEFGIEMRWLAPHQVANRFPGVHTHTPALFHSEGGTVRAAEALRVLRGIGQRSGAVFRDAARVVSIEPTGDGVHIATLDGRFQASTVVVAAGAWAARMLEGLVDLPEFRVTQEQLAYFRPTGDLRQSPWPTFISRTTPRRYGMTTPDGLVKVAEHHTGPVVDPDDRSFEIEPVTWKRLCHWVGATFPGLEPEPVNSSTCLYASMPDEDFVLDRVGNVVIGAGLSGHGFKFVPEIGRRLADLADGVGWAGNPFALHRTPRHVGASGHK